MRSPPTPTGGCFQAVICLCQLVTPLHHPDTHFRLEQWDPCKGQSLVPYQEHPAGHGAWLSGAQICQWESRG